MSKLEIFFNLLLRKDNEDNSRLDDPMQMNKNIEEEFL